jgi:hypothetical protein
MCHEDENRPAEGLTTFIEVRLLPLVDVAESAIALC